MNLTLDYLKFVICIFKDMNDLELRKLYQVIPDEKAETENYIRVIDESGEDYLYPKDCFAIVDFPKSIEERLLAVF
jgi:hypothetical protein